MSVPHRPWCLQQWVVVVGSGSATSCSRRRSGGTSLSITNKCYHVTRVLYTRIYKFVGIGASYDRIYNCRSNRPQCVCNKNKAIFHLEHHLCLALSTI